VSAVEARAARDERLTRRIRLRAAGQRVGHRARKVARGARRPLAGRRRRRRGRQQRGDVGAGQRG